MIADACPGIGVDERRGDVSVIFHGNGIGAEAGVGYAATLTAIELQGGCIAV